MNAERLPELPPAELRPLFEPLQLTATYPQDRKEVDIEITLHGHTSVLRTSGEPEKGRLGGAQVCPVLLTGCYSNLRDEFQKLAVNLETLASDEFRTS